MTPRNTALANFSRLIRKAYREGYEQGKLDAMTRQSSSYEWCTDCKEYDKDKHCCHRYTKLIRETVEELTSQYKWHDLLKDPTDLPSTTRQVNIAYRYLDGEGYVLYTSAFLGVGDLWYSDGRNNFCFEEEGMTIIAWKDIEPFEGA